MIAKREVWNYSEKSDVWVGKYLNSRNLPHWHPDCELICVEKGKLNVICENKNFTLNERDAFFINTEKVHYMRADIPDTVLQVIIFDYGTVKDLFDGFDLSCPYLGKNYDVSNLYNELKRELHEKKPFYKDMTKNILSEFFIKVLRREKSEKSREKSVFGRLKTLLDKINSEYDTITFETAYKFMAMDKSYFCRYFKKATGMSYTAYVNLIKIDNAMRLMRKSDILVTDAALSCGFGSIRHFNKTFKDITGYAPTDLPPDYVLTEYEFHTDSEFNPTLADCVLLESV